MLRLHPQAYNTLPADSITNYYSEGTLTHPSPASDPPTWFPQPALIYPMLQLSISLTSLLHLLSIEKLFNLVSQTNRLLIPNTWNRHWEVFQTPNCWTPEPTKTLRAAFPSYTRLPTLSKFIILLTMNPWRFLPHFRPDNSYNSQLEKDSPSFLSSKGVDLLTTHVYPCWRFN